MRDPACLIGVAVIELRTDQPFPIQVPAILVAQLHRLPPIHSTQSLLLGAVKVCAASLD